MATEAEARYNLRTVARRVAAALGVDPTDLTYDERRAYNQALAAEILKYPNGFTSAILTVASRIKDQGALSDSSFAWGEFASEVGENAVDALDAVAGVGEGVKTAFRWSAWLIPLALVAFVVLWLMNQHPPRGGAGAPA